MYFLIYSACPNKGTEAHKKYASGNIACWINTQDREVARIKSQQMIERTGWAIENLEKEHPLSREMAEASPVTSIMSRHLSTTRS